MRFTCNKYLLFIAFSVAVIHATAAVKLPAFFSDHMVLQQKSSVKIWGEVTGNKAITVKTSWDKKTYRVKTDGGAKWHLYIKTPVAGGPYQIEVNQENKIILNDVLIGEVWICSGQSNMDMPVQGYATLPIANSADLLLESPDALLRVFHVEKSYADKPLTNVKGNWAQAEASSINSFSAVGYQFAKYLRKNLGVPVGIIQSTWGGSPIEAWMDKGLVTDVLKDHLKNNPAIKNAVHQTPANLYNAMIAPLIGYNIAGVVWYQGEQNRNNYFDYLALQYAMVSDWRQKWGIGIWPFYLVQLAPMYYPKKEQWKVPLLREAQLKLADTLSNTGVAIIIDAGEERNIHPADKTIVAKRLAYMALANAYHKKGIPPNGPKYKNLSVKADTAYVSFSNIPLGMTTYGKKITQFEIAGADHIFHPAAANLKNNLIAVFSAEVKSPLAVRYAFKDWCIGEIYSVEGLPASPFRTDNWTVEEK
ncbi:sialate O-acetylesterase [Pedobacter aquatilis]|uniref:sialate O-acetylesterase n=1 Tax=Pedobacter aquatilis TaxID=351343 RepID=UPI0029317344|nr:sialate O-acetylesterase [Pedobacter aquatilis]